MFQILSPPRYYTLLRNLNTRFQEISPVLKRTKENESCGSQTRQMNTTINFYFRPFYGTCNSYCTCEKPNSLLKVSSTHRWLSKNCVDTKNKTARPNQGTKVRTPGWPLGPNEDALPGLQEEPSGDSLIAGDCRERARALLECCSEAKISEKWIGGRNKDSGQNELHKTSWFKMHIYTNLKISRKKPHRIDRQRTLK